MMKRKHLRDAAVNRRRDVYFELQQVGNYMRVTAIDSLTREEVTMAGPATGSEELLKREAVNKLNYVLRKKGLREIIF